MVEVLKGFPDNVAAFACHGHLMKVDYETVLIPAIEHKLYCSFTPARMHS